MAHWEYIVRDSVVAESRWLMSIQVSTGEAASDWALAVRQALAGGLGAAAADDLLARLLPVVPAGYDELNWPNSAAIDLPIVDRIARSAGAEPTGTAMMHFSEAGPDEWRFRVYRVGGAIPIADLLPLLDNLGFRAIDERAFHFDLPEGSVWLQDVGVQVPASVDMSEGIRAEVQQAFLAEFDGTVEVDGLNRLVLTAGLTARQVEVLRAYSRYLRQIGFPFS